MKDHPTPTPTVTCSILPASRPAPLRSNKFNGTHCYWVGFFFCATGTWTSWILTRIQWLKSVHIVFLRPLPPSRRNNSVKLGSHWVASYWFFFFGGGRMMKEQEARCAIWWSIHETKSLDATKSFNCQCLLAGLNYQSSSGVQQSYNRTKSSSPSHLTHLCWSQPQCISLSLIG